ncbi:signal peptidase I [Lachnospiraceae bacterium PF1-22]
MQKRKLDKIILGIITLTLVAIAAVSLTWGALLITRVVSTSMDPTLKKESILVSNRLSYRKNSPKRGDVICFYENGQIVVKRIIGLPREEISFVDGYVYIDNQLLEEPYIKDSVETHSTEVFNVPEDHYFVLGDNRENSLDSRFEVTTYIPEEDILGRAFYVFNDIKGTTIEQYKTNQVAGTNRIGAGATEVTKDESEQADSVNETEKDETEEVKEKNIDEKVEE